METILWNNDLAFVQWGAIICASLAGAVTDMRAWRIPNWLTIPAFLGGLVFSAYVGGTLGLLESVAATLLVGAPFVVLFLIAAGGAGDAKMMGAVGAWLGLGNGLIALVAVLVTGAGCGLAYAVVKGRFGPVWGRMRTFVYSMPNLAVPSLRACGLVVPKESEMLRFPYGLGIFLGITIAASGRYLFF